MLVNRRRLCSSKSFVPHNLIDEILLTENLIHQNLDVMTDVPIKMHIDASRIRKQFAQKDKARTDHAQIGSRAVLPRVGIGELLDDGWFLRDVRPRKMYLRAVVGFRVERRIDIDKT